MQHFGIARQHIGYVHLLSTKAFASARKCRIERDYLEFVGTGNVGIRYE